MDSKVDKQLALEIWLGFYGPIDEKWHQAFLLNEDLDFICTHFTVEQITEAFGNWRKLDSALNSLRFNQLPRCSRCGVRLGKYGDCYHCAPPGE